VIGKMGSGNGNFRIPKRMDEGYAMFKGGITERISGECLRPRSSDWRCEKSFLGEMRCRQASRMAVPGKENLLKQHHGEGSLGGPKQLFSEDWQLIA